MRVPENLVETLLETNMGVSKNRGTQKSIVYTGKPY